MIWLVWAVNLFLQALAATFTSRARNSGSLKRHVMASVASNGVWILQLSILFGTMQEYLTGKHGHLAQFGVGLFYTVFTVIGSISAHYWGMRTENGKSAVGASKKYAQITNEEWAFMKEAVSEHLGSRLRRP